jgi:hypothetical protein
VSALADVQALLGDGGVKGACYVVDHLTKLYYIWDPRGLAQ